MYKEGGLMTSIEHISFRHSFQSGFEDVSRFAKGTTAREIKGLVDEALARGSVGPGGSSVVHDFGRVIGTDRLGNPASRIQIFVQDGIIRTAYPIR